MGRWVIKAFLLAAAALWLLGLGLVWMSQWGGNAELRVNDVQLVAKAGEVLMHWEKTEAKAGPMPGKEEVRGQEVWGINWRVTEEYRAKVEAARLGYERRETTDLRLEDWKVGAAMIVFFLPEVWMLGRRMARRGSHTVAEARSSGQQAARASQLPEPQRKGS